jgi:hypothetical protein
VIVVDDAAISAVFLSAFVSKSNAPLLSPDTGTDGGCVRRTSATAKNDKKLVVKKRWRIAQKITYFFPFNKTHRNM